MEENGGFMAGVVETVKTVVYALLIAGIFRTLFFQPFWIPSGSMKDTLLIGDFLFVNKMAYGYSYASCPSIRIPQIGVDIGADDFCGMFEGSDERFLGSEPERGDVVVFRITRVSIRCLLIISSLWAITAITQPIAVCRNRPVVLGLCRARILLAAPIGSCSRPLVHPCSRSGRGAVTASLRPSSEAVCRPCRLSGTAWL